MKKTFDFKKAMKYIIQHAGDDIEPVQAYVTCLVDEGYTDIIAVSNSHDSAKKSAKHYINTEVNYMKWKRLKKRTIRKNKEKSNVVAVWKSGNSAVKIMKYPLT
jgi:hypothetical protein